MVKENPTFTESQEVTSAHLGEPLKFSRIVTVSFNIGTLRESHVYGNFSASQHALVLYTLHFEQQGGIRDYDCAKIRSLTCYIRSTHESVCHDPTCEYTSLQAIRVYNSALRTTTVGLDILT